MRFSDALKAQDPGYEVFTAAHALVFDKGDPNTAHIDRLSKEARLVYLLWCFDGEVHNGGFDQFFTNSLGNHSSEILDFLKEVGASNSVRLLSRAMSWFQPALPASDRQQRWLQYERFSSDPRYEAEIEKLDSEFYEYEDNLGDLVRAYVAKHPHASVAA